MIDLGALGVSCASQQSSIFFPFVFFLEFLRLMPRDWNATLSSPDEGFQDTRGKKIPSIISVSADMIPPVVFMTNASPQILQLVFKAKGCEMHFQQLK